VKARSGASLACALLFAQGHASADEPTRVLPWEKPGAPVESQLSVKVALGADYRSLFGVPIYGGDVRAALGIQTALFTFYGTAGFTLATTQYGLTTTVYELGCSFERRFDRFTFGLPFRPSYLRIARVTTGGALDSLGVGVAPFVGFDLLTSEGHALYVAATMNLDEYLVGSNAFAWGPTFSLGYRDEALR
jgi:hypothetical protein